MTIVQAALTGALIGGLYALMATGLSVTSSPKSASGATTAAGRPASHAGSPEVL